MKVHIHAHTSSLLDGAIKVEREVEREALWSESSFTVCCTNAYCNVRLCLNKQK